MRRSMTRRARSATRAAKASTSLELQIQVQLAQREEDAFAERGVGLDHVEQHVDRGLRADRQRQLLEPLARLGADRDGARQYPAVRIGDDLDEAGPLWPLVRREAR